MRLGVGSVSFISHVYLFSEDILVAKKQGGGPCLCRKFMGLTPDITLGARENNEGLWEEVSSTLSPEESISVSTLSSALD